MGAKHRREVTTYPGYDWNTQARCEPDALSGKCPRCTPQVYAGRGARHRADRL